MAKILGHERAEEIRKRLKEEFTEQIARAIANAIGELGQVQILHVNKTSPLELERVDLLAF